MIGLFVASWLLYWAVLLVLPVEVIYPQAAEALLIQVGFVLLVLAGYLGVGVALKTEAAPTVRSAPVPAARAILWMSLFLSLLGLLALTVDKIYVQGIDFSQGLAVAREQWRLLGEAREGVSSVFSAAGYLLGNAYFVALLLLALQPGLFGRFERAAAAVCVVFLALVNSGLSGGRSSLLLVAGFLLVGATLRRGARLRDLAPGRWQRWLLATLVVISVGYVLYVTQDRASANGVDMQIYVRDGMEFLGLRLLDSSGFVKSDGFLDGLSASMLLALGYVVHSFATLCALVGAPDDGKAILFIHVLKLLARLGMAAPPDMDWLLAGRFPSLPGAAWFQYGTAMVIGGALLLGMLTAGAATVSRRRPGELLPLGVHASLGVVLLLSPLLFAGDLLAFPFIAVAIVMMAAFQYVLIWWAPSDRKQAIRRATH